MGPEVNCRHNTRVIQPWAFCSEVKAHLRPMQRLHIYNIFKLFKSETTKFYERTLIQQFRATIFLIPHNRTIMHRKAAKANVLKVKVPIIINVPKIQKKFRFRGINWAQICLPHSIFKKIYIDIDIWYISNLYRYFINKPWITLPKMSLRPYQHHKAVLIKEVHT